MAAAAVLATANFSSMRARWVLVGFQVFNAERPLDVRLIERDGRSRAAGRYEYVEGEEAVAQLGRDALPLLDRLNRMVLRNLKALRDLKTAPLALTVQNYGQLNVAHRQANLMQRPSEATVDPAIGQENDG